jgi:hypothetical protein
LKSRRIKFVPYECPQLYRLQLYLIFEDKESSFLDLNIEETILSNCSPKKIEFSTAANELKQEIEQFL